ncbi:hypothetical protein [Streptomyces sp. NPDC005752]|uniref:hypothetical protein n=1 Tax=Streptomyces sp. NPDC005752 TaxID=3157065 RepID=UPI0033E11E64
MTGVNMTVAAHKSRDVGDRIGWDVSEGWGMTVAALVAGYSPWLQGSVAYEALFSYSYGQVACSAE